MAKLKRILTWWVLPIFGAGLAIGILIWLYKDLEFGRFAAALQSANHWWLFVLVTTILGEQLLRGWKWRQILFDLKAISTFRLFGATLAGYGATTLVPFGISPFVRSWLVARLENLRFASVLVTTAVERFIDGVVFALIAAMLAFVGTLPTISENLRTGLGISGVLSGVFFASLLWLVFRGRSILEQNDTGLSRFIDWVAAKGGARLTDMRTAIAGGIIWPRARLRQIGIVGASVAMKAVGATHLLWAGLAVNVALGLFDYLFLLVFAGFALVLSRLIRVPGGYIIGSGFALHALGVPDEKALAMIMFTQVLSAVLVVGTGLIVLWRSGIDIRSVAIKTTDTKAHPPPSSRHA